jgi:hypothetical protein
MVSIRLLLAIERDGHLKREDLGQAIADHEHATGKARRTVSCTLRQGVHGD